MGVWRAEGGWGLAVPLGWGGSYYVTADDLRQV